MEPSPLNGLEPSCRRGFEKVDVRVNLLGNFTYEITRRRAGNESDLEKEAHFLRFFFFFGKHIEAYLALLLRFSDV